METLKFNIKQGENFIDTEDMPDISEAIKQCKAKLNTYYLPIIGDINGMGGYVDIEISNDSFSVLSFQTSFPMELLDKVLALQNG